MTVRELIERLSGYPADAIVYGSDYEEGFYPITAVITDDLRPGGVIVT